MILLDGVYLPTAQYHRALHILGAWWCMGESLLTPAGALHVAVEAARIAA